MSEKKSRKASETDGELLDALLSAMGEVAPDTEDDIDSFLKSCGYDLQELNERSGRLLNLLLEESPLHRRNCARQEMEQPAQKDGRQVAKRRFTREDNIVAIQALQIRYGEAFGAYHRIQDISDLRDAELEDIRRELESFQSEDDNWPSEKK